MVLRDDDDVAGSLLGNEVERREEDERNDV